MADVVLLHGTTQGPRGWDRLVSELARLGHRSVAVDLEGDNDRTLSDYVEAVERQVPSDFGEPLVVAHSGAGVLLPGTAVALEARCQVWIAAFVPDGRRSFIEEVPPSPADVFNPEWLGKDPTADPILATYFLFHDCDLDTLQWALSTVRLFSPQRLYAEPIALAADIPSVYVVASKDRTLRPDWCRREAQRRLGARVIDIGTGHCPHVSRPKELAELLDHAVDGAQR